MAVARRAGVFALAVIVAVCLSAGLQAAKMVRQGESYTNKTKLFQVTAPRGCGPLSLSYEVREANKKGAEFFEEVAFYIKDVGELYHAGVRRLSPVMRQKVQQTEGPLAPPQLGWLGLTLHLGAREKMTGAWKPVSFEDVQTKHGPGVLSVNQVEGGRFLTVLQFEGGNLVPKPAPPALVVVLMIQNGEHLIYVTGQADASGDLSKPENDSPACVQQKLREMIESLTFSRPLPPPV